MHHFLRRVSFLLFLSLSVGVIFAQQNTILIIADDVSPDYFGFFSTTTDTATAPNIRAMLSKGIKFTKALGNPVCSPTRASMFTGRYPFRTGVGTVVINAASAQLDTSETGIARILKSYSPIVYNTACVGKWHLHVSTLPKRLFPNYMGFDLYSGNFIGQISNYYSYQRIKNGIVDTVSIYGTTQTVNDAISWMDTMNTNKPFFLWLAFNAPHSPFHLPPANLCNTTGLSGTTADINANPKKYFKAAIEAMDTEIGRLVQYLYAHNLMDSTNIIFIGDNGNSPQVAQIPNAQKKAKQSLYDYGSHVPMIISGPAVVNKNRTSDALVSTTDLFATIAEISGNMNWRNAITPGRVIDSKSILPIIKNQQTNIRTWNFTEQFSNPIVDTVDGKSIRNQDYHLIRFANGTEKFFNQTMDVNEDNDLITGAITQTDIDNYTFLCDSLNALIGTGICKQLTPLSLNLTAFTANAKDNKVLLNWKTTNEVNVGYFEIERSINISNWYTINKIKARNTTTINEYLAVDNTPPGKNNYYRLKVVNVNGEVSYSKIQFVSFGTIANNEWNIFPNPVVNSLLLSKNVNTRFTYKIKNVQGQIAKEGSGNSAEAINVSSLKLATYFIEILDDANKEAVTRKFVKK